MSCIFNKAKLKEVLRDFHTITRATISVWDADFNQLLYYPKPMAHLCAAIKSSPTGKEMCFKSDMTACIRAAAEKKPYTFTCHAGLVDTAVPVYYEGEIIAYMMFGQIRDTERYYSDVEKVIPLCKRYGIGETEVREYYEMLPLFDRRQIEAASNFLSMCTTYLHISQMIKVEKNHLASGIDNYITENIKSPLTVEELCKKFNISKNMLYDVSHRFFNTTIRDYIIRKRLDMAKHLLTTTQISVSEISETVGFSDYNYFIRAFGKRIGFSPLEYRKRFPLETM